MRNGVQPRCITPPPPPSLPATIPTSVLPHHLLSSSACQSTAHHNKYDVFHVHRGKYGESFFVVEEQAIVFLVVALALHGGD